MLIWSSFPEEKQRPGEGSNLPKVTWLVRGRAGTRNPGSLVPDFVLWNLGNLSLSKGGKAGGEESGLAQAWVPLGFPRHEGKRRGYSRRAQDVGGWAVFQSREEPRPPWPCPSPGTGRLEVQCVARQWPDWVTGKIKGAKLGLGLREISQKGTAEGQPLNGRLLELRVGAGISPEAGSPCELCTAGMWGHQARASS